MTSRKLLLRVLSGETCSPPPIWLMRQAGRYLPEYRAARAEAGSFLDLCYNPRLATEVTLQPIRRYGFDGAILFADILLVPHGLGRRLWFAEGEGPRLDPLTTAEEVARLRDDAAMHAHLAPVYETVNRLSVSLPAETTLIGFAGAPWTVATYMIAGRGKDGQAGARTLMRERPQVFEALIDRLVSATTAYLVAQVEAGAEVVKIFDSWAGALVEDEALFARWCLEPMARIARAVKSQTSGTPVIAFPRGATPALYLRTAEALGADGIAVDERASPHWARETLQPRVAVQGGLSPDLLRAGGDPMRAGAIEWIEALRKGPHVFNLGHGITPDVNPDHVADLVATVRSSA